MPNQLVRADGTPRRSLAPSAVARGLAPQAREFVLTYGWWPVLGGLVVGFYAMPYAAAPVWLLAVAVGSCRTFALLHRGEAPRGWQTGGRVLAPRRSQRVAAEPAGGLPPRSPEVVTENEVFKPPFLGSRVVRGIAVDEVAAYVNETALFRNQWGFRPEKGETDAEFKDRIRPVLREQLAEATASGVLVPQVVYGYFAVNADGDDLVVWSDDTRTTEAERFHFPRQSQAPFLCIADFFRPLESGDADYAAFSIVTMGPAISEATAKLFAGDEYSRYLLLHGLGVEMAEALAEYWHRRIREEWGFGDEDGPTLAGLFRQQYRGSRYSWGYPACPDLEDNVKVCRLLGGERIGLDVSEDTGYQYQPEQTTSAIVCHHPRAKYFVA